MGRRLRVVGWLSVAGTVVLAVGVTTGGGASQEQATKPDAQVAKKPDLPLEPAGTIEFATDEGTWISLDVAPYGRPSVFGCPGDLSRLPGAGGDPTPIVTGLPFDSQPRVSPDGTRVAFISDRAGNDKLWVATIDGA